MSFSSDVKQELALREVKTVCCRKSLLYGLLCDCAVVDGKIVFECGSEWLSVFLGELYKTVYRAKPETYTKTVRGKTVFGTVLSDKSTVGYITGLACGESREKRKCCQNCVANFLGGVFMASGSVTDPHREYHAEILLSHGYAAEKVVGLLSESGLPPKTVCRKTGTGIYYKSNDSISELLGFLGADRSMYEYINIKIENELRNNANRSANFETVNIEKTVSTAQTQIAAINLLIDDGLFGLLPEELRTTARLRLENDECTLAELAALHEPKISKSGLCHRLRKIISEAEKIKSR